MSGTLQNIGSIIFPKPEIKEGIKKKNTITTACAVVRTLKK
jgi:hypothetical protein